jgi:hypothetical protein
VSSEVRGCCGLNVLSFLVVVVSEDTSGLIATFVVDAPVGDDLSVGSGGDGGGTDCNSATAAARFAGQSEILIWAGE